MGVIDRLYHTIKYRCFTNIYNEKTFDNFQRDRDARPSNLMEIKALIGLLYISRIHKSSHVKLRNIWATDGTGLDISALYIVREFYSYYAVYDFIM